MAAERTTAEEVGPNAQRAGEGRGAAFFDLDRTLIAGSSGYQFVRAAYRAGLLSRRRLLADGFADLHFRLFGASDERSYAVRERVSRALAGVRVRDVERLGPDVLAGLLPRIYPRMLALAYEHQDAGRPVYIVTAAGHELAEVLARVLALDGAIGSHFSQARGGVYTGRPGRFVYGEEKAAAVARLAARAGIALEHSYAYSDSASDLPLLELVGHPVAVNPDAALARLARERGWEVLRFERLGRRLKAAVAVAGAAAAGGAGSAALVRRSRGTSRLGGGRGARGTARPPLRPSAPRRSLVAPGRQTRRP
jgi:HAD superfamily hydrolase (TIGR01490 family)